MVPQRQPSHSHCRSHRGQAGPGSGAADGDVDTLERAREPPCLSLCASPHHHHHCQPLEPGTAAGTAASLGQEPFPAGTGPSWRAQRHQNSPGKAIARDTLLATASAVSPVRQEGGFVPSLALCPCLGTSSRFRSSPLSPLRARPGSQEGAAQISREAAPEPPPHTRPHPAHREARRGAGGVRLPRLQNNPGAQHLPGTCTCPLGAAAEKPKGFPKPYPRLLDPQWGEIRDTSGGEILQIL